MVTHSCTDYHLTVSCRRPTQCYPRGRLRRALYPRRDHGDRECLAGGFFIPGSPEPCLTMSGLHPLFSGPCRAMRVYTPTLRPSIRRDSSKAEASIPTYKTLRSLCQVMEGGTLGALLPRHPLHGRTMSLMPLVASALESTLQSECFLWRGRFYDRHV